jgi:uroporphyrinogen-III synthase
MKLRALITRPEEDAVPLAHALSQSGIAVAVEPLLAIRPIPDAAIDLDGVQAVLFTSANGARVFAQLAGERNLPGWHNLRAFTVGAASAAAAETAGFSRVESAGGDVAALAQLVVARLDPKAGALFHGAGSAVAGDLQGSLAAAGFEVRRSMIYEARPADRLSDGTIAALAERSIDLILLFSPRTAATFQSLVRAAGDGAVAGCGHAAALCLSPAVAGAVGDLSWRSVKTADRPDMPAMLELVAQYLEEMGGAKSEAPAPPAEAAMAEPMTTTSTSDTSNAPVPPPPPRRRDGLRTVLIAAATAAVVAGAIGLYWSNTLSGPGNAGMQIASVDPELLAKIDDAGARAAAAAGSADDVGNRLGALSSAIDTMRGDLAQIQGSGGVADGALPAELASLKDQLMEIGQQLAALKDRVVAFEQQLAELKAAQSTVAQGASADGAALEQLSGENETLRSEIANLKSQLEPLNGLASRVDALDLAVKEQSAGSANSALALAAGQLNATLATARSFTAELNALGDVTAADPDMASEVDRITAPVRDFAQSGIPTLPDLRSRFPAVASAVAQLGTKDALSGLTGAANDGGWFERVLDRLSSVIVVRPVGDVSGDTPAARVARAEAKLQAGDLGGAIDELAALSGAPAAAVAEWLGQARARLAADQAIVALQSATIARLRPPNAAPSGTGG